MKKIVLIALLSTLPFMGMCITPVKDSTAVTIVQEGMTFKAVSKSSSASYTKTAYKYQDTKGKEYPIYLTSKGRAFVFKISAKTGKEYRYYLPEEIDKKIK